VAGHIALLDQFPEVGFSGLSQRHGGFQLGDDFAGGGDLSLAAAAFGGEFGQFGGDVALLGDEPGFACASADQDDSRVVAVRWAELSHAKYAAAIIFIATPALFDWAKALNTPKSTVFDPLRTRQSKKPFAHAFSEWLPGMLKSLVFPPPHVRLQPPD
jgi:hypothetical protein